MEEIKQALLAYLPEIMPFLADVMITFLVIIGSVYASGRMLGIVNTARGKNTVAFVVGILYTIFRVVVIQFNGAFKDYNVIDRAILQVFGACIMYVLLGQRLFSRVDGLLDKFAPDANDTTSTPSKKRVNKK